jgi:hypothetical protein
VSWLSFWFPNSEPKVLEELESCIEETRSTTFKNDFILNIQKIQVFVTIQTNVNKEGFFNVTAVNTQFERHSTPVFVKEQLVRHDVSKKISINKIAAEFDKYVGHHESHRYLVSIAQWEAAEPNEDEFEDVENYLEWDIKEDEHQITILPTIVKFNESTLEKLEIFKVEWIPPSSSSAERLILEEHIYESEKSSRKQGSLSLRASLQLVVPENMFEAVVENVELKLSNIYF